MGNKQQVCIPLSAPVPGVCSAPRGLCCTVQHNVPAAGSIPKLKPDLLAGLTADLTTTSARLIALRDLLPAANVSRVVAERPQLLLQDTSEVGKWVGARDTVLWMLQERPC